MSGRLVQKIQQPIRKSCLLCNQSKNLI
uniref:Uncharacterized protein n=1 Tax=Arundo donax TaxID=35708 RepID=A0A0A8ZJ51_ARUDO